MPRGAGREGGPLVAVSKAIVKGSLSHVLTILLLLQTWILHSAKHELGLSRPFLLKCQVSNQILFLGYFP